MVAEKRQATMDAQDERKLTVSLTLESGYKFEADTGLRNIPCITVDEPPPLGEGSGPNPARLLTIAVANCLSSSLLFCLRKARIEVSGMKATATATMARNEEGRLRVTAISVVLFPFVAEQDFPGMERCINIFEEFCPVTAAVRGSVDVCVAVSPLPA